MNILISHVYSTHNNGDAAILSAQIEQLKHTFKNAHIHALTIDTIEPGYTFDGIPVFNSLMHGSVSPSNNRFKKLALACCMMSYTVLWVLVLRLTRRTLPLPRTWQKSMQLLVEADMQVCVGGGYLRAKDTGSSTVILALLFHQIWLAKLLHKPVYLFAQSFVPYPSRIQRTIATLGLNQANLILVREAQSKTLLTKLGINHERVVQVPDSAFMFKPKDSLDVRSILEIRASTEYLVGITVRAWLPDEAQATYEKAMAGFIDYLCEQRRCKVIVIAQVTSHRQNDDDRAVGKRIDQLLRSRKNVTFLDEQFTHYEIKSIFSKLDYLVGTRFHSVIFALTAGVPALAIEYEHKTRGIMQDLDLEKWVMNIEDVTTAKLVTLFSNLVHERQKYVEHLHKVLPPYILQARSAGRIIKQNYERTL